MTTLMWTLAALLALAAGVVALQRYRPNAVPALLSVLGWLSGGLGVLALIGFFMTGLLPLLAGILFFVVPVAVWLARRLTLESLSASGAGRRDADDPIREVNTAFFTMTVDRLQDEVRGWIVKGTFSGRDLSELSETELRRLRAECAADPQSVRLLTLYIERRPAAARPRDDFFDPNPAGDHVHDSDMKLDEAWQVLGLASGATPDEIRAAHRRLMRTVHPDRGGSDYLAARVNRAKDLLLAAERPIR